MNKSSCKIYDNLPLMLSVPDVAKVLGISRAGAYKLAHGKEFTSMKIGSRIRGCSHKGKCDKVKG